MPKLSKVQIYQRGGNDFMEMNKLVGINVILSYPNFRESFIIHKGASKTKREGVIIQNGKL